MVGGGGGWANPLQTLSQGLLLTFCNLIQEFPGNHKDVREDPKLDNIDDFLTAMKY